MISIVTPFHNCPELLPAYEKAVKGAQVVVIDNASDNATSELLREMVNRVGNGSMYFRNEKNELYSHANNQGLKAATGEIVVFLNSDVVASGNWLPLVERFMKHSTLFGATASVRAVDGFGFLYLEGWCLWGYKHDFEKIGGWNETDFPGLYWEDNELCLRAIRKGFELKEIILPLKHLSNYTSSRTPGAYDNSLGNREAFERMAREWWVK